MHVTARTEYALRAMLALAAAEPNPLTAAALAEGHGMPSTFLKTILSELRGAELIVSSRGPERGYRLTRPAGQISVGEVLRVVDGSLTEVRPDQATGPLDDIWQAADAAILGIVDEVTLGDLVVGDLPPHVRDLLNRPA